MPRRLAPAPDARRLRGSGRGSPSLPAVCNRAPSVAMLATTKDASRRQQVTCCGDCQDKRDRQDCPRPHGCSILVGVGKEPRQPPRASCTLHKLRGLRRGQPPRGPEEATTIRSVGHGTPTALRPCRWAALYSSSVATHTTAPRSVVEGSVIALKPRRHEPSSVRSSTCWPGSGILGGPFKKGNPARTAGPPNRTIRVRRRRPHRRTVAAPRRCEIRCSEPRAWTCPAPPETLRHVNGSRSQARTWSPP